MTSESPAGSDSPREIVDELEEKVADDAGRESPAPEDGSESGDAPGDVAPEVPGSPEPTD